MCLMDFNRFFFLNSWSLTPIQWVTSSNIYLALDFEIASLALKLFFTTTIWKQCLQFNCKISTKATSSLCTVDCYSFVLTSNHVSILRYSGFSIFIQHVANILKVIRYGAAHVLISIQQLTKLTCSKKRVIAQK